MSPRVLLLLALALALAGCAKPSPAATNATNNSSATSGVAMAPMPYTVTVGGGLCPPNPPSTPIYTMSPAKLTLTVGMPVNLTLKNTGCAVHDLVIEGIDGARVNNTAAGASASVVFTPMKAGQYKMYCTIGGGTPLAHKDNGMSGDVTVQ